MDEGEEKIFRKNEFAGALEGEGKILAKRDHIPEKFSIFDLLFAAIKNRGSVRKFQKKDVSRETLEKILLAAIFAPSAGNFQPWEFIVVKDPEIKKHLAESSYDNKWIAEAPVIIVSCINMRVAGSLYGERGEKLYGIQDVAAATENLLLAATSLGLGATWVGAFSEPGVKVILEIPDYVRPAAFVVLGFPAEEPHTLERHSLSDVVHFEKFGKTPRSVEAGVRADGGAKVAVTNLINNADETIEKGVDKIEAGFDLLKEKVKFL